MRRWSTRPSPASNTGGNYCKSIPVVIGMWMTRCCSLGGCKLVVTAAWGKAQKSGRAWCGFEGCQPSTAIEGN